MRILGLVGATHDSGLAILDDGWPTLVLEEERLSRIKRTKAFPTSLSPLRLARTWPA